MLDRRLYTSMTYPADYGFIEGTLGEDGDPLDALVLLEDPVYPGVIVEARPVGVLYMRDEAGEGAKLICVPADDPRFRRQGQLLEDAFLIAHIGHPFRHADPQVDDAVHRQLERRAPRDHLAQVQRQGRHRVDRNP